MSTLYILQLEEGKYYVGKTDNLSHRYEQHKNGRGSEWTKLYKPIEILETRPIKSRDDETNTTKELMRKYGVENVRGGAYCQVKLPDYVRRTIELEHRGNTDACYKCGSIGHFAVNCTEENESENESEEEYENNACYRCGRHGHWANQCYARTDMDGFEIDESDED